MRNPVIDLTTLIGVNDIPDWTYVESGLTYDPAEPPTTEQLDKFLSKSPISLVDKVQCCVCVCVCERERERECNDYANVMWFCLASVCGGKGQESCRYLRK